MDRTSSSRARRTCETCNSIDVRDWRRRGLLRVGCGEGRAPVGNVIILSAEDGPSDTIIPRLLAAGADLNRVYVVSAVRDPKGWRALNLQQDLELLAKARSRKSEMSLW